MEACDFKLNLREVKHDLLSGIQECSFRGLHHSVKWLSELNFALRDVELQPGEYPNVALSHEDLNAYYLVKSYFDLKEYDRAAYFAKTCKSPRLKFLYFYSRYLSVEKKKLDNMTDSNCPPDPTKNEALIELKTAIETEYFNKSLDGYCLYLYAVVLKRLDSLTNALDVFVEAVNAAPLHWGAWQELAYLVPNKNVLVGLKLPDHWMKHFFLGFAYLEQLCNKDALDIYKNLFEQGFQKSSFIKAQTAIVYHNRRGKKATYRFFRNLENAFLMLI